MDPDTTWTFGRILIRTTQTGFKYGCHVFWNYPYFYRLQTYCCKNAYYLTFQLMHSITEHIPTKLTSNKMLAWNSFRSFWVQVSSYGRFAKVGPIQKSSGSGKCFGQCYTILLSLNMTKHGNPDFIKQRFTLSASCLDWTLPNFISICNFKCKSRRWWYIIRFFFVKKL
jgi:hypothetical protein